MVNVRGLIIFLNHLFFFTDAYNKEGVGILHSLRSFDREQRKEYAIPVAVSDAGRPSLTATAIVNVIIGDVNDNKMKPGYKEIFVYNYMVRTVRIPYLFYYSLVIVARFNN